MIIANMQVSPFNPWMPRLAAFGLALLLAASVVYWVLRWPTREAGPALPVSAGNTDVPAASTTVVAQLLGARSTPAESEVAPDAASRFQLTGIIALGGGRGVAVVSVDGKPPKHYRAGSQLDEGLVLQSIEKRRVAVASGAKAAVLFYLDLPPSQP